ncbi:peptidase M4 family protein, partial [Sodalis-like symbiont of Bactericera trigonica]
MTDISNRRFASVIPPYLLKRIMEKGNEHQRLFERHTLTHVHNLMGRTPAVAHYSHAQPPGKIKRMIYYAHNNMDLP